MPSFFLEPDRTEPHIPASVLAVVAFGFSTSAFLVGIKPWSKNVRLRNTACMLKRAIDPAKVHHSAAVLDWLTRSVLTQAQWRVGHPL